MHADLAREESNKANLGGVDEWLNGIFQLIAESAAKGRYELYITVNFFNWGSMAQPLNNLGYTTRLNGEPYNGKASMVISWSKQ